MKVLMILAASLALALAACHRDQNAAGGSSSMQTPSGAATGQGSEGSSDRSTAPKRPASK